MGFVHLCPIAHSAFQFRFKVIHKFTHLVAWAELNCLVILVNSNRVSWRPVVDLAGVDGFGGTIGVSNGPRTLDQVAPVRYGA